MATELIVNGTTYNVPEQGSNPVWGEAINSWMVAVTNLLATLGSATDLQNTEFNLLASQSGTTITNLSFDTSTVRSFIIEYTIYRASTTDKTENGTITGSYNGTSWNIIRESDVDCGLTFSCNSSGQFSYDSDSNGVGTLSYRSRTFTQ